VNYNRKSRRRFFLLMRSRTALIYLEFRGPGGGGLNTPNPPRYATDNVHRFIAYHDNREIYLLTAVGLTPGGSSKVKVIPQQAEVAQGVPVRLRSRIFLTFSPTRVVGRQPYTPADFTPGEIPGTHFQGLSRPQGTWFRRGEPRK